MFIYLASCLYVTGLVFSLVVGFSLGGTQNQFIFSQKLIIYRTRGKFVVHDSFNGTNTEDERGPVLLNLSFTQHYCSHSYMIKIALKMLIYHWRLLYFFFKIVLTILGYHLHLLC